MANVFSYDWELESRLDNYLSRIPKLLDENPYITDELAKKLSGKTDVTFISERIIPPMILALNALHPKYGSVGIIPNGDDDPLHCADMHIYGRKTRQVSANYAQKIQDMIDKGISGKN